MARTGDDYRPCVALWPDGRERKANVFYVRLMGVEDAAGELRAGRVAWVAPEDVGGVKEMFGRIKGNL